MDQRLADLLALLELEQLEVNLFRGASRDIGAPQVFGGQVLGQALSAAAATVEGRVVHSLHAYFLRRGDCNAPIVYQVDRSLDGHSFANRRVVAIQHGQQIFNMAASFQASEAGFDHQVGIPPGPPPASLADSSGPPGAPLARAASRVPACSRATGGWWRARRRKVWSAPGRNPEPEVHRPPQSWLRSLECCLPPRRPTAPRSRPCSDCGPGCATPASRW